MTLVFFIGPLVAVCLIMLTVCREKWVRSGKQTRLMYFPCLSVQPHYCITHWFFHTTKEHFDWCPQYRYEVCDAKCMLSSSLNHKGP